MVSQKQVFVDRQANPKFLLQSASELQYAHTFDGTFTEKKMSESLKTMLL